MVSFPVVLLVLSLPLGAVVYTAAAKVIQDAVPGQPILSLLIPLFIAGLAMMPLLIPFFDRKAKQDLAEYRRQQAVIERDAPAPPAAGEGHTDGEDAAAYDGADETESEDR